MTKILTASEVVMGNDWGVNPLVHVLVHIKWCLQIKNKSYDFSKVNNKFLLLFKSSMTIYKSKIWVY